MNKKILTIIVGVFLLAVLSSGIVSADEYIGIIENPSGINISDFTAGTTTTANFSFDYQDIYDADKHYPLIFKINISYTGTEQECQLNDCSVWKNDFAIDGVLTRYYMFGLLSKDINLECSEESPLTINHQMGSNTVNVSDGIFYCYNITEGTIETLKKRNKVFLNIFSNPALYPATYKITAELFYLTDERAPFVNITNKDLFDKYYRENDNVLVLATIDDASGISEKWTSVTLAGTEIFPVNYDHLENGKYYFSRNTPVDIMEGYYDLTVNAIDNYNNTGNDSVVLKIDRTGPNINLIQPNDGVVGDSLLVVVNVTDEKAGVDNSSVEYRLREMNGSSICPENGIGTWDCYNSDWSPLLHGSESIFGTEVNTTEVGLNGEYWLEIRAYDILGNEGILE